MKRREFVLQIGGVMVAIPTVLAVAACGGYGDDDDDSVDASGEASFVGGNSDSSGHTHNFTVQCADLGGNSATYTATGSGHSHTITLDASQLTALGNGDLVSFNTTEIHAHSWEVRKPSNAC